MPAIPTAARTKVTSQALSAAGLVSAKDRYTTAQAIERELETIAIMESSQGQAEAISTPMDVLTLTRAKTTLTTGQYQAILETATSREQVMAWHGVAGVGKTYSLKLLAQQIKQAPTEHSPIKKRLGRRRVSH